METVFRELELANHFRSQQAHHVGKDRVRETGVNLLTDGRTPNEVAPFEDENIAPRLGEIGRTGQAVVATADDDCII